MLLSVRRDNAHANLPQIVVGYAGDVSGWEGSMEGRATLSRKLNVDDHM